MAPGLRGAPNATRGLRDERTPGALDSAAPLHTEQPHERRERGSRPLMLPDSLGSRTHDAPERLPSGGEAAVRAARHPTRPFAPRGDPQANPRPAPPDISPFTKLEKPRGAKTAGNFRFGPTSSPSSSRAITAPWATMQKPRSPATAELRAPESTGSKKAIGASQIDPLRRQVSAAEARVHSRACRAWRDDRPRRRQARLDIKAGPDAADRSCGEDALVPALRSPGSGLRSGLAVRFSWSCGSFGAPECDTRWA